MEKHCTKRAITQIPFGDTGCAAFCLRATAEWEDEGIISSELLAMVLPQPVLLLRLLLFAVLPVTTAQFSRCVPLPPTHPPAFSEKAADPGLSLPLDGTLLSCVSGPRAPNCSGQAREAQPGSHQMRALLWLNSSNFETDLSFSRHWLRRRSHSKRKNPNTQRLALSAIQVDLKAPPRSSVSKGGSAVAEAVPQSPDEDANNRLQSLWLDRRLICSDTPSGRYNC
ncbi:hypothetical protein mRhiFer1_009026 [Rhinolophus ferrumequinum]|uniref:Uncharacterized protein n=1 Tax=Rhinolophus ferrumequinum TaxID=59479 RepID=A0A7J7SY05_RHIFE|nr:hypothetical protein mRhiFer1_009026 [Rhinolophus ferrumequinum]